MIVLRLAVTSQDPSPVDKSTHRHRRRAARDVERVALIALHRTINAVRLCVAVLAPAAITVLLNRFDGDDVVHRANLDWLADSDGLSVVATVEECVASVLRAGSIGLSDPDGRLAE